MCTLYFSFSVTYCSADALSSQRKKGSSEANTINRNNQNSFTTVVTFLIIFFVDDFSFPVSLQIKEVVVINNQTSSKYQIDQTTTTTAVNYKHFCGGTYLGNGCILTASHCVSPL